MELNDSIFRIKGEIILELHDAKTGRLKSRDVYKNMFVTAGKNDLASGLSGVAGTGSITYCALGTSAVAPALGDTKLGTEIVRKLISVRSVVGNVATFQTFFGITEGNGTLREAGLFGGAATSQPDSATLYCHAAISRTKSANDTLTCTWNVTIG